MKGMRQLTGSARLIVSILCACVGAACSSGPRKQDLVAALNDAHHGSFCYYAPVDMGIAVYPLKVELYKTPKRQLAILQAMQDAGYISVSRELNLFTLMDVIQPTSREAGLYWTNGKGFCVGNVVVDDVKQWTEPGRDAGTPIEVTYTWRLTDVPDWAKRKEFDHVPGMKAPVQDVELVQRTNTGWKVAR